MAQISYGTITITDTNDIERIYPVYCRGGESSAPALLPLTNWKENISEITVSGDYIWQRIVTKKSGINVTQNDYGDAVRLTGEEGDAALNISAVEIQYGSSANWSTSPSNWGSNTPAYDSTKPYYWTRTRLKYENNTYSSWVTNKDYALTDAITKSVEANDNAAIANSIAQHANENSQGAMSQATEANYKTEALAAKVKHYWWDSTGAHIASGINGADVTEDTASTYGFNSLVGLASMTFGYNSYKAVELDGSIPALKFYKPSKTTQGDLTATLNSNGLILSEGGIEAGTKNTNNYIYVYSKDDATNHTLNINNSGNKSDWRIIAGNNFGVDKAGNLYASNAHVSGIITVNSGSNLSAGLSDYSTTSQMNTAIGTATNDMATKTYVSNQGYQNATQVSSAVSNGISSASVSDLSDGSSYSTTSQMNTAIGNATNDMATQTYVSNNYATQTSLNTEINQRKAQYGTCSTSADTAAKVVTCANFELVSGARIAIKFTTANTTDAPTLNVNSKGAKAIWNANAVASATNPVLWGANATLTFVYDGTQWVLEDKAPSYSIACSTSATTQAKAPAVVGALVINGTRVDVNFSTANTYVSGAVQLNLSSTGAKNIYIDNAVTSTTNTLLWNANTVLSFVRQGVGWYLTSRGDAAKTATSYITNIDSNNGITIKAINGTTDTNTTTGNYIKLNASGLDIYKGGVSVALYGDTIRIGKYASGKRNVYVTDSAIQFRNYQTVLAEYGDNITLYQPGTSIAAVSITNSGATFTGGIVANSLTINDNGSSYNAWDAINITGYSLDIEVDATGVPTSNIYNNTYLYPHLYHNGTEITLPSSATTAQKQEFYNKFLWYEGDSSTAVQGDYLNRGRILASYNDYWKVTYSFNDGATEGAEPIQQVIVDPSTYITRVNDNTIKVHSKNWNESTGFVQINNQGNIIATGQIYQENNMPLTTVQLVKW